MPNKYYLRGDWKAVTKEQYDKIKIERPYPSSYDDSVKYFEDFKVWKQKLLSLPAFTVHPDYLNTLYIGWFEGEEQKQVYSFGKWMNADDRQYNNSSHRRLTIVAPQDADRWEAVYSKFINEYQGQLPITAGAFFRFLVNNKYQLAPATPQPITGEEISFAELKWNIGSLFNQNIKMSDNGKAIEGNPAVHAIAEYVHNLLATSRPFDAVEFAEWCGGQDLKLYPEGWCQPGWVKRVSL